MSNSYGENLRLMIFGQSHALAIGMTLEGIPAGLPVDMDALLHFLARRSPGHNVWSSSRQETDSPEFLCGLVDNHTCGAPITAIIRNTDACPGAYTLYRDIPRPGHADYTAWVKYGDARDFSGGGQFSGRLTAPLCIAGGLCLQFLARSGIHVLSRIASIGTIADSGTLTASAAEKDFPVADDAQGVKMRELIANVKTDGDSVGGVVECAVMNVPTGLGEPMFGGMENKIASILFGIPAVKGVEFGDGFQSTRRTGSHNNDAFLFSDGTVQTETNHCGGILGGISDGMPILFRVAFKPTPSIAKPQTSVNLRTGETVTLTIEGRHDPCIVPRAVPCVEAAAALAVYDALLGTLKG